MDSRSNSTPRGVTVFTGAELDAYEPPPREFITTAPLPIERGARVLLHGREGSGKSNIAYHASAQVLATGGRVLELIGEGSRAALKRRMGGMLAHLNSSLAEVGDRLVVIHGRIPIRPQPEQPQRDGACDLGMETIERETRLLRPDLVVLDNLVRFYGADDENDARAMAGFLDEIDAWARSGISLLLIHHDGRQSEARGSTAITAWADSRWQTHRPSLYESCFELRHKKERDGEPHEQVRTVVFEYSKHLIRVTWSDGDASASRPTRTTPDLSARIVSALQLAPEGLLKTEIRGRVRASSKSVSEALQKLQTEGQVVTTTRRVAQEDGRTRTFTAYRVAGQVAGQETESKSANGSGTRCEVIFRS